MSDLCQARENMKLATKAKKAALLRYKIRDTQTKYICVCFTYISVLHWFREQADNYNGNERDPEENQGKVHVMNLGYD